jgi:hypothetical protein
VYSRHLAEAAVQCCTGLSGSIGRAALPLAGSERALVELGGERAPGQPDCSGRIAIVLRLIVSAGFTIAAQADDVTAAVSANDVVGPQR